MYHLRIKLPFSTLPEAREAAKQSAIEFSEGSESDRFYYVAVNIQAADLIRFFHFSRIYGSLCERADKKVKTPTIAEMKLQAAKYAV